MGDSVACGEGHLFCQDCLKDYVKSIVYGTGKSTLACLGPDCDNAFSTVNLGFIEPKMLQGLIERQQSDMLAMAFGQSNDEKLHPCPFCSVPSLVPIAVQEFKCLHCGKASCQFCKVEWRKHIAYGYACSDVEGDDESKVRLKTEEAMTEALVRKCHKCSRPLIKESGCNKMTCVCGAILCYVCHQPAPDGYQHFCQHTSAPGQTCRAPGCGKCSLVDEVAPDDVKKVEAERLKGERERELLGVKGRKKIGGNLP